MPHRVLRQHPNTDTNKCTTLGSVKKIVLLESITGIKQFNRGIRAHTLWEEQEKWKARRLQPDAKANSSHISPGNCDNPWVSLRKLPPTLSVCSSEIYIPEKNEKLQCSSTKTSQEGWPLLPPPAKSHTSSSHRQVRTQDHTGKKILGSAVLGRVDLGRGGWKQPVQHGKWAPV